MRFKWNRELQQGGAAFLAEMSVWGALQTCYVTIGCCVVREGSKNV